MTKQNPRNYPDTLASPESGRPMVRGEKQVTFRVEGQPFSYMQPGWWCSLTDPDDMDGQLVDEDNQVAEMARRSAKAIARGERLFVPVVIRALRQRLGLTQREAGQAFGAGDKSFEKYEAGEIQPSEPTKRLLRLAMERPELFRKAGSPGALPQIDDAALAHRTLEAVSADGIYGRLFTAKLDQPAL